MKLQGYKNPVGFDEDSFQCQDTNNSQTNNNNDEL